MFYGWLYDRFGWIGLPGASLVFGLTIWAVFVQLSYYYYFVRHRDQYVPDYQESADLLRKARNWSLVNILGNTLFLLPIQLLIVFKWSRLYVDIGEHSRIYLIISAVGALAFAETGIYWTHRVLHMQPFYRWFHAAHHQFREPTPHVAYAFNPVDSFLQSLPYHLYIFIVPTNVWVYFCLYGFSSFWTVLIHDRVRWIPATLGPIINYAGCHAVHHWCYRYNYGNYFTFWDKLCGTYCTPDKLPKRFFSAKLAATPPLLPQTAAIVTPDAG
jgi:lathosterol oxidase